jgi:broad specificity phosphatase PhoE
MEITLIRHGRSLLIENDRITYLEFNKWVKKYDHNGVFEESTYPSNTIKKAREAKLVITSDLNRAIQSAKLLNPDVLAIQDPIFRETELPTDSIKILNLKLRPSTWAVILRVIWFAGYSNDCESLMNAKIRAKQAAQRLINYAAEYDSIVIVGHGIFNMLISKELAKLGWKGKRKRGAKHWNSTTYSLRD